MEQFYPSLIFVRPSWGVFAWVKILSRSNCGSDINFTRNMHKEAGNVYGRERGRTQSTQADIHTLSLVSSFFFLDGKRGIRLVVACRDSFGWGFSFISCWHFFSFVSSTGNLLWQTDLLFFSRFSFPWRIRFSAVNEFWRLNFLLHLQFSRRLLIEKVEQQPFWPWKDSRRSIGLTLKS